MDRVVVNSILSNVEMTAMDLLVMDVFISHFGVFGVKTDINGRDGVKFDSGVVVEYYPILEDRKAAITARLKKLVSKHLLWKNESFYGFGMRAADIYGAMATISGDPEQEFDVIKRKKSLFRIELQEVWKNESSYFEKQGWPKGKDGAYQLNEFYKFWTEKVVGKPQLKWEMNDAFEISRRLGTWLANYKKREGNASGYKQGVESIGG